MNKHTAYQLQQKMKTLRRLLLTLGFSLILMLGVLVSLAFLGNTAQANTYPVKIRETVEDIVLNSLMPLHSTGLTTTWQQDQWQGGAGQENWADATKYWSAMGNFDISPGGLRLAPHFGSTILLPERKAISPTDVGGKIWDNTTWNHDMRVTSNVTIKENVTLTIAPGTVIQFMPNTELRVEGTLLAVGTETAPIIFTSAQSAPIPGNWQRILFVGSNSSASVFDYALIRWANTAVYFDSSGPIIKNSIIRDSNTEGVYIRGNGTITPLISNTMVISSGYGVRLEANGQCAVSNLYPQLENVTLLNTPNGGIYAFATSYGGCGGGFRAAAIPSITNSLIASTQADTIGVYALATIGYAWDVQASPQLTNSRISGFQYGVKTYEQHWENRVAVAQPSLHLSLIDQNTTYGIDHPTAYSSHAIDATNNWWGIGEDDWISGPYHTTTNPTGSGDWVSNKVTYSPYLSSSLSITGVLESSIYDTGQSSTFTQIEWTAIDETSANNAIKFQLATSPAITGPWTYYGPTNTNDYYTISSGQPISSTHNGHRYVRYKVYMSRVDPGSNPVLKDVTIRYRDASLPASDPINSAVEVSPTTYFVGETVPVTVTLRDAASQPITGKAVEILTTGYPMTVTQPSTLTNGSGQAFGAIQAGQAQTLTVQVRDVSDGTILSDTPVITFISLKADFQAETGSLLRGTALLTVTFTNLSSPSSQIIDQKWDFGDGSTSTAISPTYTFSQAGHYTVTLVVTGTGGITDVEAKPTYVTISPEPTQADQVDLNKDGYVDLVVSNHNNSDSYIYWGSSTGYTATNRAELPTSNALGNAIADLDNDGDLDIVFANYSSNSRIYWGNGTQTGFSASSRLDLPTSGAHAVAVADLNRDGYLDIVFANYSGGLSYIYWGQGNGNYSDVSRSLLPTVYVYALEIADLDGDQYLDLIFANYGGNSSYIYWGSATGYATAARTTLSIPGVIDVGVADLNKDNKLDLVFANHYSSNSYNINSYVYWGDGTKTGFSSSNSTNLPTHGVRGVAIADLNNDGNLDVTFANYNDNSSYDIYSYVYWGTGNGVTTTNRTVLPTIGAAGVIAGDLDRDGWTDLMFAEYYDGAYRTFSRIYWNGPTGFNSSNRSIMSSLGAYGLSASLPATGDTTAFGRVISPTLPIKADFQVAAGSSVRGTVPLTVTFANLSAPSSQVVSQTWGFGDGSTSTAISPTHTFEQVGHYTVTLTVTGTNGITDVEQKLAYVTVSPAPTTTVDLDEDGYTDLVVSNHHNGNYNLSSYIYWGSVEGYSQTNRLELETVGAVGNAVADLDNDGDLDVVFANYAGDSYLYWGDGSRSGFSSSNRLALPTSGAHAVSVADLNGDGYQDLVFANYSGSLSYIYWGSGNGYSTSKRTALPTVAAVAVEIAHLDEDEYLDLVFANYSGSLSYIYWGSATGYSTLERTTLPTVNGRDVKAADLDNDGDLDVAFANYGGTNSYIYWGDGTSDGFSSANRTELPTAGGLGVATAHLNQDDYPDLVFANHYQNGQYTLNGYVYWGSSSGFTPTNRLELPTFGATGVIATDLNRDSWSDLVFASYYDGVSYNMFSQIYWNSPVGFNTTNVSQLAGIGSQGVSAVGPTGGDTTAFGRVISPTLPIKADFQVAAGSSVRGTVPLTVTFANLSAPSSQVVSQTWGFGDGSTSTAISPTHTFEQVGHYTVTLTVTGTNGITDVEQKLAYVTVSPEPSGDEVDLDGDGYIDLVVSNYHNGSIPNINSYIYWGGAEGYDPARRSDLFTQGALGNAVADLNNDGALDIAFANNAGDSYIYWGNGSRSGYNTANRTSLPTSSAYGVGIADLNQDGYLELIFANYSTDGYIYWGAATGFSASNRSLLPTIRPLAVEIADLDEDGYLDLIFANYYTWNTYDVNSYIYWGSATGYSVFARTELPTRGARDVGATDVDGNGYLDVIFANHYSYSGGYNIDSYVYWGNGTRSGYNSNNRLGLETHGAFGQAVTDLNGDGYLDIAFANYHNGETYDTPSYIYWGSGTGLSMGNRQELPVEGAAGVAVSDLDRDGWQDLLFAQHYTMINGYNATSNRIYWNSPAGFNLTNLSHLPGMGSYGVSTVLPLEGDTTAFGRVISPPPLNFTPVTVFGSVPLTVTFAPVTSTQTTWDSFSWNFGDGATSSAISPTHVFSQVGVYTVTLQGTVSTTSHRFTGTNRIIATPGMNIALGRPATAGGTAIGEPTAAIDHNLQTNWTGNGNTAWLQVDLGNAYNIGQFLTSWRWNETQGQSATALIEVSLGGSSWETVYTDTLTAALNGSIRFITPTLPAHGRYIRFYIQSSGSQVALAEFQAFGEVAIDAEKSTLVAAPSSLTANGLDQAMITATLISSIDLPIADWPVSLRLSSDRNSLNGQPAPANTWVNIGSSNAQGIVTATLATTRTGAKIIEAQTKTFIFTQPVTLTFTPGPVDANQSQVAVSGASTAAADSLDSVAIQVTARDVYSNPIPTATVVLTSTDSVNLPSALVTNAAGQVTGTVTSTQVGLAQIGAIITDSYHSIMVSNTVTATFQGPDLVLSQSGPSQVTAGYPLTYNITIANDGLLTATNIVVTDTLPAAASFVITSSYPYTYEAASHTVVWEVASLPKDGEVNLNLQVQVAATATGTITNALAGTLAEVDLDTSDNQATLTTTILAPAAQLVVNPNGQFNLPIQVGNSSVLTITLSNPGTGPLENVAIAPPPYIDWVTINPTAIAAIGAGQSRVVTLTASPALTQVIGKYRDFITVTTTSGLSPTLLPLEVYAHPGLIDLNVQLENNLNQAVAGAYVSLEKTTDSVLYTQGQPGSYQVEYLNYQTAANGQVLIPNVEVGVYSYTLSEARHVPNPATGLITITASTTQVVFSDLTALPTLTFIPGSLRLGVAAGGSRSQLVQITNSGPGHAEDFAVETPTNLPWISAGLPPDVLQLDAGQSLTLTLFMTPPPATQQTTYQIPITVTAANPASPDPLTAVLAATVDVTTTNVGDLVFEVTELGTTTGLSQATVSLVNQTGRTVVHTDGSTELVYDTFGPFVANSSGEILFEDLPVAEYSYVVKANGFYAESGTVQVEPIAADGGSEASLGYTVTAAAFKAGGQGTAERGASGGGAKETEGLATWKIQPAIIQPSTLSLLPPSNLPPLQPSNLPALQSASGDNHVQIGLERDPFTYNWTVIETTIQDTYAMTVEVTYEAEVPKPLLYVSPLLFCPGETPQYLVANVGPVTMNNIKLLLNHAGINFGSSEIVIGTLAPGEVFTGTISTSGSGEAAQTGSIEVTANYGSLLTTVFQSLGLTQKLCASGGTSSGGSWTWSWTPQPNGQPTIFGSYQGSQPTFPSESTTPPAPENPREQAKLTLSGEATLERQAFLALLELNYQSGGPIEDMIVNIRAKNAAGDTVVNGFAVTPPLPTLLGTLSLTNPTLLGSWTIIPEELGITDPQGEHYSLQAQIVYTQGGQVYTTTTLPAPITVLPQPRLKLTFSHSQPDSNNDFNVQVKVTNQGYGTARSLKLDLSQVTVLNDLDANSRSLIFDLLAASLDGQPQPKAYIFDFGDLPPDTSKTGRWDIHVRAGDGLPLTNPRVTRFAVGCRHLPYQGLNLSPLIVGCGPVEQFFLAGECPFCGLEEKSVTVGGPINTGNGNYNYAQSTPSIPTVGEPLQLTWSYNSLNSGAFPDLPPSGSALGTGWTHNYNLSLDLSDPNQVVFKAAHGTPLNFEIVKDRFEAAPGVHATLTRTEIISGQYVYTLTAANQATYIFTDTGQVIRQLDPQGHTLDFDYDSQDRLVEVSEPESQRHLAFTYDTQGRLIQATDNGQRTTGFGYEIVTATSGQTVTLLTTITDTRNQVWDYDYTPLSAVSGQPSAVFFLSRITDPDNRLVEATGFDAQGRAITQTYRGESLSLTYAADGRRFISDGLGRVMTHTYNSDYLLVGTTDALGQGATFALDEHYNRTFSRDKNGNITRYVRTEMGLTTAITDALGHVTRYEYDDRNNLIKTIDALGRVTQNLYDAQNHLISTTNALGDSTFYTYNGRGQQTSVTDALGHMTRYGYDTIGQRTVITDALGHAAYFEYDSVGRVVTTTDALGRVTINEYDGADNLVKVTENYLPGQPQNYQSKYNLVTEYTYDSANRRLTTTDTLGRVKRTEYDPTGRLLRTIQNVHPTVSTQNYLNQYNLVIEFQYDQAGNMVGVIDTLGNETRTEFDELHRIERIIVNYVDGNYNPGQPDEDIITRYAYDANSNKISAFDALGRETRTEYDELNRIKRTIANYQDGIYNPAQPDEDVITQFTYDEVGNQKTVVDPLGRLTTYTYDALNRVSIVTNPLSGTTQTTYDAVGNQLTVTDAENRTTTYGYDALNRAITVTNALSGEVVTTYDAGGNQLSLTDANSHTTRYGYDSLSRRIVITDALNYAAKSEYDAAGRLVKTVDPLDQVTLNEYNDNDQLIRVTKNYLPGQPQNYLNEYNIVTEYTYDPVGQPTLITDTLNRVTRREYDKGSRLVRQIVNYVDGVYSPAQPDEDIITRYAYDGNSNPVRAIDALGRETRTEYDDLNRVVRVIVNYVDGVYNSAQPDEDIITRYQYDGAGNQVSTIDTLGRETRAEYDPLNRLSHAIVNYQNGAYNPTQPDEDLITAYNYDKVGNTKTLSDPLGRITAYAYDDLNRVLSITNPLSGTTSYTYDPAGNLLSITDAKNQTIVYAYDALNRVVTTTNALNGQTIVLYDEVGNQKQVTNPKLQITTYQYDSLYRLKKVTDAANQVTTYTYDPLNNQVSVTDPESNTTVLSYDSLNRVIQTTNPLSGTTQVSYDALGNRLTTTDANNHTTTFAYDDLNRVAQVTDPNNLTTLTTYDGLGNRLSMTNEANETTEFAYDEVNRLILTRDPLGHETTYRYDGAGNRVALTDAESRETRYGYDALDRLVNVIENYVDGVYTTGVTDEDVKTSYSYDAVGNRTQVINAWNHPTSYDYDALNRQIEVRDPLNHVTRYGYDSLGNRTVITDANLEVTLFTYDDANRLTAINYPPSTPDVSFSYDNVGNRLSMSDGSGTTNYDYDDLYRLTEVTNGANQTVGYTYDPVGNRTQLIYPNNQVVTYTYDAANRLETVKDWKNGQFGYNYDNANRLTGLTLPNGVSSSYSYDDAGRLTLLTHTNITETLASYAYSLDDMSNRTALTETLVAIQTLPGGVYLEEGGLMVAEAENFGQALTGTIHNWLTATARSGYTGTAYLQALPDLDVLYQTGEITSSPSLAYPINFTTPGTYTVWVRGLAANAAGDSVYIGLGSAVTTVTGFAPDQWEWANLSLNNTPATLPITSTGLYTLNLWMREDGLRIDRLLMTTDTNYLPADFGPAESTRQTSATRVIFPLTHTIVYTYDNLYRLTSADYSTGEQYAYDYDPVGNRLEQIINGDTTFYLYDAANRLASVDGQPYTFDNNGNLLNTGVSTNTFDVANRLTQTQRATTTLQVAYNGLGDRVAQTTGATTTHFALDAASALPEVIYTSEDNAYLHLPGVIMAESAAGEVRYLLSDGLGSIRQATDASGAVAAYNEFDPYGNPIVNHQSEIVNPYGFTGEWWENEVGLLHLRARWYAPEIGTFLSRDPLLAMSPYAYASNNPINRVDPSGYVDWASCTPADPSSCMLENGDTIWGIAREVLAMQGNPYAYDTANQEVNQHINRVMVPQMWNLNGHLHSDAAWNCPACRAYNPAGNINLPASWIPGRMPPSTPPTPTPPTPVPPTPPAPPVPQPNLPWPYCLPPLGSNAPVPPGCEKPSSPPQPDPGGVGEIVDAMWESHRNDDDGIIFGGALAINSIAAAPVTTAYPEYFPKLEANGTCFPVTGYTGGIEFVYDFKHQERGIFYYHGPNLNIGNLANFGTSGYIGKTRGFVNFDYDVGVEAYGGYFATGSVGVDSADILGGAYMEAAPLSDPKPGTPYKKVNRDGVFATYYSLGIGAGASYLPPPPSPASLNLNASVTNYTLGIFGYSGPPFRVRYGVLGGGIGQGWLYGNLLPDIAEYQKTVYPNRIIGARVMENEIRSYLGGEAASRVVGYTNPLGWYVNEAISELWDFAYKP